MILEPVATVFRLKSITAIRFIVSSIQFVSLQNIFVSCVNQCIVSLELTDIGDFKSGNRYNSIHDEKSYTNTNTPISTYESINELTPAAANAPTNSTSVSPVVAKNVSFGLLLDLCTDSPTFGETEFSMNNECILSYNNLGIINPLDTSKIEQLSSKEKLIGNAISKIDQKEFVNEEKIYDVPAPKASKLFRIIKENFKKNINVVNVEENKIDEKEYINKNNDLDVNRNYIMDANELKRIEIIGTMIYAEYDYLFNCIGCVFVCLCVLHSVYFMNNCACLCSYYSVSLCVFTYFLFVYICYSGCIC